MVPSAIIVHCIASRLRLKIDRRRGDETYFADLAKKLASAFAACKIQTNPLTGSIVMSGESLDAGAVAEFGRREGLFELAELKPEPRPISHSIIAPLQTADRSIQSATSGRIDLPGAVFIALLLFGMVELIRGNWRTPPWYTAFWYAFGLYSKTLFDQAAAWGEMDAADG